MCFLSAGALLWPQCSFAQLQPHRAEYALRLGTAVNAARVGSAVQDLTLTCDGWRLKRDVKGEIALSAIMEDEFCVQARRRGAAQRRCLPLPHPTGSERRRTRDVRQGTARRKELRAEITSPTGPAQILLPPHTLMPVALIDHLIERLRGGPAGFRHPPSMPKRPAMPS